jgi:hypothetical protein
MPEVKEIYYTETDICKSFTNKNVFNKKFHLMNQRNQMNSFGD